MWPLSLEPQRLQGLGIPSWGWVGALMIYELGGQGREHISFCQRMLGKR